MKYKLATWNISCGVANVPSLENWNPAKYIADIINDYSIDVLLLQEVIIKPTKHMSSISYITEQSSLKYNLYYELSPSHLVDGATMGISILSRFPLCLEFIYDLNDLPLEIIKDGNHYFSHHKAFMGCYIEKIDTFVITGHCPSFGYFKSAERDYVNDFFRPLEKTLINQFNGKPIVIGADFNTPILTELMPEFSKYYSSLFFSSTRPFGTQTDYIYVKNISCSEKKILPTLFDHHCCIVELY